MAGISGRKFAQIASTAELCFFDKVFWGEILPSSERRGVSRPNNFGCGEAALSFPSGNLQWKTVWRAVTRLLLLVDDLGVHDGHDRAGFEDFHFGDGHDVF